MARDPGFTKAQIKRLMEVARETGLDQPVPVWRRLPDGAVELTARSGSVDSINLKTEWDEILGLDSPKVR